MPKGFGKRTYHQWVQCKDLAPFQISVEESELLILAQTDLSAVAKKATIQHRREIEDYISLYPEFQTSLEPIEIAHNAPSIIQDMASAAKRSGVGPFAAVAGAIAEHVGRALLPYSSDILIENGGDIFIAGTQSRMLGIYAGSSALSGKLALKIDPSQMPCGVCTSSGTVGHSLSFGRADAAIVIARSTALADACATALGNMISSVSDIANGLKFAEQTEGIDGAAIIVRSQIGAWGKVYFVKATM
jgi:hypothetical protein